MRAFHANVPKSQVQSSASSSEVVVVVFLVAVSVAAVGW